MLDPLDLLPHRPPMRLVEEVVELVPGAHARARRRADAADWYFQGHFPDAPVVPAIILVELLAQTGGLAACAGGSNADRSRASPGSPGSPGSTMRVAAFGAFKFPAAAKPGDVLEAHAHLVRRMGRLIKIEGTVSAGGVCVASGSVTLVEVG